MPDLKSTLRDLGLSVTPQRLAVLKAVADNPHSSAEEIATMARSELGTISRQAIYDTLSLFTEKGIIRRIQPANSPSLYERRIDDNHHHLVCRLCGNTQDVDCTIGHAPCLEPSDTAGFHIDEAEVIFWGTCPKCLPSKKSEKIGPAAS